MQAMPSRPPPKYDARAYIPPPPFPGDPAQALAMQPPMYPGHSPVPRSSVSSSVTPTSTTEKDKELPVTVLGCPECAFICTSNNQMCRHMFLTCHGVHQCAQCSARLICWAFAPGVQKLFVRAKKDGVLVDTPIFETAEKHHERTGHANAHIPGKERYVKPGVPEDYGLTNSRAPPVEPAANSRYCCPDCQKTIATWTQMTKHLDSTKHSLCRCAECDVAVKCYGMSQPLRHEKLTGHRGLLGIFRMKPDYLLSARGSPAVKQYQCEDCGIGYLHPLHLLTHLAERHRISVSLPKCEECAFTAASLAELCQHRLTSGHETFVNPDGSPLELDHYAVSLMEPAPLLESITSGQCRVLYQCPACYFIGTSWPKFERHIHSTKHSLAYCGQCNAFVPPKVNSTDIGHRFAAAHNLEYGTQLCRSDYEVLVDVGDEDLCELLYSSGREALPPDSRIVHQCPWEECRQVFADNAALERHFAATKHGIVHCKCCESEFSVAQEQWRSHMFDPADTPPCALNMQRAEEDCRVWVEDVILAKFFGEAFVHCPTCQMVTERAKLQSHQGSLRCSAAKLRKGIVEAARGNEEAALSGVLPVHYQQPQPVAAPRSSVASANGSATPLSEYSMAPLSFPHSAPGSEAPSSFTFINQNSSPIVFQSAAPGSGGVPPPPFVGNAPGMMYMQPARGP